MPAPLPRYFGARRGLSVYSHVSEQGSHFWVNVINCQLRTTEAARSFADLLDAVEHRGERFTIVRRGKAIARLEPVGQGHGAAIKQVLRRRQPDRQWVEDLAAMRSLIELEDRD